jgi:16S rRNA (cytosine967-C5)-methyltransferase
MTPAARLQAVIEILDALQGTAVPADRFVREFFRARRYAGSKDRAAVAERVFTIARHRSSFAWRMQGDDSRRLVIASLLKEEKPADDIAALFDGSQYGPAALSDTERAAIASPPDGEPPLHVRGEFPPFLEPELTKAFGAALLDEMQAMLARAPIDLRTNTLKTSRDALASALASEGFAVEPTPYSPWGLRLASGAGSAKLSASVRFTSGAFEFQDEAAQIAALLCGAGPGMRVLDFAAGGGGKSLALAAAMKNQGGIVAHDIDPGRLSMLSPRAMRAGAAIITPSTLLPTGPFEVVLLDAPCSGTGTWRRQPEQRWRLTPGRLAELTALQDRLLEQAAPFVQPGGRLVYATCSVLPCENQDRIARFLAAHPDFAPLAASEIWRGEFGAPPPGMAEFFRAGPLQTCTDGFFTAILQRHRWTTPNTSD